MYSLQVILLLNIYILSIFTTVGCVNLQALTPEIEKDWFRAFAAVKTKNPKIYDGSTTFFHGPSGRKMHKEHCEKRVVCIGLYHLIILVGNISTLF